MWREGEVVAHKGKREEERDVLWPRDEGRERNAAVAKKKEGTRNRGAKAGRGARERERAIGSRCAPSSWPGTTTKEALSRGCSFGQCLLFLPRSLPSLHSFSLALIPPLLPSRPFYRLLALSFPRFLSHPALFRRSPHSAALPCCIAHTRHGCLRNPSVILRTNARPRPGLSRAVRDREKSVRRAP